MMSGDESIEARQNNEFEALQAIYGDDLKDLRKKVWKKWSPLHLAISLTPQQGNSGKHEIFAKADLTIKCSLNYPKNVPEICLANTKGLSNPNLKQLQVELKHKAEELKGEEMIFQLCQLVQEFLHVHNKPATKSFYEEMLQRQKEKELQELQAKQLVEDKQRQYIMEEINQRQEMLKSEGKLHREHRFNSEDSDEFEEMDFGRRNSNNNRRSTNSFNESSEETLCTHKGVTTIEFFSNNRQVYKGKCMKHSNENHVVYTGIDKENGNIVVINEWTIAVENNSIFLQVQKQISSIEQEFNYITKLKHPNLSYYQNMTSQRSENNMLVIYVMKEFIFGANCTSLFLKQHIKVDLPLLKHIAKGVLMAVDYLHRNNVVHRDIKDSCIYINDKGQVKVGNYSIHRRMSDLVDLLASHGSSYSKKTDIFKFGIFLISLLQGESHDELLVNIPENVPNNFYDFLNRCVHKDEKERYSAAQLLNHSFFKERPVVHFKSNIDLQEKNNSQENLTTNIIDTFSGCNNQSRIINEFEFMHHLGKGAFGDVIKVRNKLDGRHYAIKRIQLNPKNKQLNKKIVREVKLLSRLNHENVVRYYNSWIESTVIKDENGDFVGYSKSNSASPSRENGPRVVKLDELTLNDNIEAMVPKLKNLEVSVTYDSKSQLPYDSSSDEDSSDDDADENAWANNYSKESESDGIEFEDSETASKHSIHLADPISLDLAKVTQDSVRQIDFMYIQMEFCEKSTLRTAIDNDLYLDQDRLWRLFREIVEGLAHIHQQGMIHRDLKPVNIFLDCDDHVKIGDFGLATTSIKSKLNEFTLTKSQIENEYSSAMDESKTGLIGTALYVAPELTVASKAIYNQKVDIYSLGIILFEMCHKPMTTNMERIKILTGLRLKEICFPEEVNACQKGKEKEDFLIRWLLDHDISKRPTSQELLQSEHIPPPVLEECELRELIRHTLNNPQLKGYKYLIDSCFKQSMTPAQNITYDRDPASTNLLKFMPRYDFVRQMTVNVFQKHGGQNLATPLLMPKSVFYENSDSYVRLMTHFGGVVTLPCDLRVPFARYIAWNNVKLLRRYSIERVYREKKVFGFQPRELYECAFDIVTPTPGNLMSDAEILYVVWEIINELPVLRDRNVIIRLNHVKLLKAILLYCGIKDNHEEVLSRFSDMREGKLARAQLQTYLISLGLSDNNISTLINLFNSELEVSKAANHFQMITKKKSGDASQLAKQALQDLKLITQNAQCFGVTFDVLIVPGLVYNVHHHSGMICQFVTEVRKKHKRDVMEVLAAGGRYDSMIARYRNMMERANILPKDISQSAVGISFCLDKIVQSMCSSEHDFFDDQHLDVVVSSIGKKQLTKEKAKILQNLWSADIKCSLIEVSSVEELQEQCDELKVPHVIMLKDSDQGTVIIRSWDKDRFQEKYCSINDVVENMQRIIKTWNEKYQESFQIPISKSDSRVSNSFDKGGGNQGQELNVSINFVTLEKLSSITKKRYENQIRSHLGNLFTRLVGYVTVMGMSIDNNIIRTLTSYLEFDSEESFQKSLDTVIERHQRHKKHLIYICDEIYDTKLKPTKPLIVLYSLTDSFYKIID